jgi:xanthine dehydrogenase iron-sulfur cluster and FAD-binding subunit A
MSAKGLLSRNPHPTAHEIQAAMTGNICRCSNYNRYVEAVLAASAAKNAASKVSSDHSMASTKSVAEVSAKKGRRISAVSSTGHGDAR